MNNFENTNENFDEVKVRYGKLLNFDVYFDYILLSFDEFLEKYGSYGWGGTNYSEIRFENDINVIQEIERFNIWSDEFLAVYQM